MKNIGVALFLLTASLTLPTFANTDECAGAPETARNSDPLTKDEETWIEFISDLVDEAIKGNVERDRGSNDRLGFRVVLTMFVETLRSAFSEDEVKKKARELSVKVREAIEKSKKSFVTRSKELPAFYGCIATYKDVPRKDFEAMLRHLGACVEKSFDFRSAAQTTLLLLQTAENLKKTIRAKIEEIAAK
jgi:hypothetical protein